MARRHVIILLWAVVLLLFPVLTGRAASLYRVTSDNVNVRSGPGFNYKVIDHRNTGDIVTVLSVYQNDWARIRYGASAFAYIHMGYLSYKGPVPDTAQTQHVGRTKKKDVVFQGGSVTLDGVFRVARVIALVCLCLWLLISIIDFEKGERLFFPFAGFIVGYIVGLILGYAHTWAIVGEAVGIAILAVPFFRDKYYYWDFSDFFRNASFTVWLIISWPFKMLNRLQFFLSKPWRPFMKDPWAEESKKTILRTVFSVLKIPFYILLFPLRIVNAAYYNLVAHLLYEFSDYLLEVLSPTDPSLGKGNATKWISMLPVRIVFYIGYHFTLTIIESIVWTVIDTFVPALTLYHGTKGLYAEDMVREPKRTRQSRRFAVRMSGTWTVGGGNYAGDGIYFGISGSTLKNYQKGCFIVARVSLGKTIDMVLMPDSVYRKAGSRDAHEVSKWGITNGYITGEWWRNNPGWWEFCLFDRQNRYNYSWRIRPVYVLSYDNGIMMRTHRGMAHWLFRGMVLKDLWYSITHIFS